MSLDALLEPTAASKSLCKLGHIISGLEEPYKGALVKLLEVQRIDGGESDHMIRARLLKAGFQISGAVIYRHRNGQCACESVVVR